MEISRWVRSPSGSTSSIAHFVEEALLRLHIDLFIGDRGVRGRAPVDHALAAVDVAALVEFDEGGRGPLRVVLVEGEAGAVPVAGGTELRQLVENDPARLLAELPDLFEKALAPEVVFGLALDSRSCFSTLVCVAMPAWSVPGCQSTALPSSRARRMKISCSVLSRTWPMWSIPVTLGGGIMIA